MKTAIYLLVSCIFSALASAQPVVKAHAWKQSSARGAKPSVIPGESGNAPARRAKSSGNLYLYLEYKQKQNILPFRIWIDGKPYAVTNSKEQNTPVLLQTASVSGTENDNDTLVAKTANQVIRIIPVRQLTKLTIPAPVAAKADIEKGNIVVEYYWRARRYTYTIPEIKILPAVRLQ